MSAPGEPGRQQKVVATLVVLALVAGMQWLIFFRTRPPEPVVEFPKELKDIAP